MYDAGDEPLVNIPVTLYDKDNNQIATTNTRDDGVYVFTGLVNGTYRVVYDSANRQASAAH